MRNSECGMRNDLRPLIPHSALRIPQLYWRRGQESNLSRSGSCRTDNGFEDREGHQAPFTLREICASDFRLNLPGNRVEIGPLSRVEFGVDEFTVDANFEGTAARLNQPWSHARRCPNASRQTGSFRFVVSDRAVFDRYFRFHARLLHLPYAMRPRRRCRG